MSIRYKSVAIEGNIGAGKTTLAHLLAEKLSAQLVLERYADNPFLPAFYSSPQRHALSLELSFLEDRFRQRVEFDNSDNHRDRIEDNKLSDIRVADYVWEKSYVFASVNLKGEEWQLYKRFYGHLSGQVKPPDIIIYLNRHTERLQRQIAHRGRPYELRIPDTYLEDLSKSYQQLFEQEKRMPVLCLDEDSKVALSPNELLERVIALLKENHPSGWQQIPL
jgi:deoxyadenosine/deoxycytidine kinase